MARNARNVEKKTILSLYAGVVVILINGMQVDHEAKEGQKGKKNSMK